MQKAIDIKWNKAQGDLNLDELNQLLEQGWRIEQSPVAGSSGDILVILESPKTNDS